jgi:hypothetical protein
VPAGTEENHKPSLRVLSRETRDPNRRRKPYDIGPPVRYKYPHLQEPKSSKNKFYLNNTGKVVLNGTFVKRKPVFGGDNYSLESRESKLLVTVLAENPWGTEKKNFLVPCGYVIDRFQRI